MSKWKFIKEQSLYRLKHMYHKKWLVMLFCIMLTAYILPYTNLQTQRLVPLSYIYFVTFIAFVIVLLHGASKIHKEHKEQLEEIKRRHGIEDPK